MFKCKPACTPPRQEPDTVKVDVNSMLSALPEKVIWQILQEGRVELPSGPEAASELARVAEAERALRRAETVAAEERATVAREAQRQAEQEKLQRERAFAQEEAVRQEEVARVERERIEAEQAREAAELQCRRDEEVRAAAETKKAHLVGFLDRNGFTGVNAPKRSILTATYPLHLAAEQGNSAIVDMLLKAGADPAVKNSWRQTAPQVAQKKDKNGSHVDVLRSFGCTLESCAQKGKSSRKSPCVGGA